MPIGGTEVGDAWIRIHSEGRGLRQEIKRDAEDAASSAGESGSKQFGKAWTDGLSTIGKRTQLAMLRAGDLSGTKFGNAFRDSVEKRFAQVEKALVNALTTGDFVEFERRFGGIRETVDAVSDALGRLRAAGQLTAHDFREAQSSLSQWADARGIEEATKKWDRLGVEMGQALRLNEQFDRDRERAQQQQIARMAAAMRMNEQYDASRAKAMQDWGKMVERAIADNERFDAAARKAWSDQGRMVENAAREMEKAFEQRADKDAAAWERQARMVERAAFEMDRHFEKMARDAEKAAKDAADAMDIYLIGRLKGSRNDLANIVGSIFAPLEKGAGRLVRRGLTPLAERLGTLFDGLAANPGAGRFAGMLSTMAARVPGLVVSLSAVAGAAAIAALGLGVLVSAVSSLLGVLTALAGSVAFAIAGALLTIGPLALAAVAGIATLTTAFATLDGELDDALVPLKAWGREVATQVRANLFTRMGDQLRGLMPTLREFVGPLMANTAARLSDAGDRLIAGLQSAGVAASLAILRDTLPAIAGNLAGALGNLLTGLLGFFAPISQAVAPLMVTFERLTARFSEWANKAEGQNTIRDFFDRAWVSAEILWGLVKEVGGALGTLFGIGKTEGDTMLGTLQGLVDKFGEWAEESGKEDIQEWFEKARETAENLSEAVGAVSEAIGELDTPENHQALQNIIDLLGLVGKAAERINEEFAPIQKAIEGIGKAWDALTFEPKGKPGDGTINPFGDTGGKIKPFGGEQLIDQRNMNMSGFGFPTDAQIMEAIEGLRTRISGGLASLGTTIGESFSTAWSNAGPAMQGGIETAVTFISSLPGRAGGALATLGGTISGRITTAWQDAQGALGTGLATAVTTIAGLPARAGTVLVGLAPVIGGAVMTALSQAGSAALTGIGNVAATIGTLPGRAITALGNLGSTLYSKGRELVQGLIDGVGSLIGNVATALVSGIRNISLPKLSLPPISLPAMPKMPWMASGGVVSGARVVGVGEAGPEAIVPLRRPLAQVDPSVRAISALLQGKGGAPWMKDNTNPAGRTVTVMPGAISVVSRASNERLVAAQVLDRFALAVK